MLAVRFGTFDGTLPVRSIPPASISSSNRALMIDALASTRSEAIGVADTEISPPVDD
jgi:hypothetical protein